MEELDLKELFQMFWARKFQIIIIVVIAMIIGVIYTLNCVTPMYKSSTTLILGRINASESSTTAKVEDEKQITQSELSINSNLVSTYSELIKSKSLIKQVKENLKTNISETALRNSVTVSRISDTELIEITVANINPYLASQIANEIASVFSDRVEEIYNISNVYIIDEAIPSLAPYNVNHTKDVILFGAIGVILSAAYIVIYNLLDTTVKNGNDMEKITNTKNLISIPFNSDKVELITFEDSKSIVSEAFRTLRTNVQFSSTSNKKTKTYLVTSCFQSEGKSYIAANLAITFAQAGKKVILIDSDMRRGRQAKVFNFPNECGLSNYISNIDPNGMEINYDITQFIKETGITNLNIITSGNVPPNPSELLASTKVPDLIIDLKAYYDVIIFDGAPVLPVTDSLILARLLDSTVLVARYNRTKKDDLAKAKSDIENVGGKIIGTCLNAVATKAGSNDLNYYYYYGETEEKTFKDIVKQKIKNVKKAFKKFKKLKKINKKASKKIRIIEEVHTSRKPVVKEAKREKKDVVKTVIEEVGKVNYDEINNLAFSEYDNKSSNTSCIQDDVIFAEIKKQEDLKNQENMLLEKLELEERKREEEARRIEELRLEEERKRAEEARRLEELRLEEERRRVEEARRIEELRLEEERRRAEEEARRIEELRLEEERRRAEEARRLEELRLEEERRRAEEARRLEELRLEEERRRAEEEARRIEELRLEEERKRA
ncbi:MAG: polysaccharide biosynthesis tyrosine autokinase, partial [Clostridia bacterium]|nr:polysaccharide biosynthesis tyrosine autokinase [Clostridia bacterium]